MSKDVFYSRIKLVGMVSTFLLALFFVTPVKAGLVSDLRAATTKDQAKQIIETAREAEGAGYWGRNEINLVANNIDINTPPSASSPPTYVMTIGGESCNFVLDHYANYIGPENVYWFFKSDCNEKLYIGVFDGMNINPFGNRDWMGWGEGTALEEFPTETLGMDLHFDTPFIDYSQKYYDELTAISTSRGIIAAAVGATLEDNLKELLKTIGTAIMNWVDWMLESAINALLIVNVNQDGIINGWAMVRNASNIILVLVLLLIAMFNAIRFQIDYYNAKVLIPRLAAAAVLINFSFFISKAIIDLGNILSNYFTSKINWLGFLPFDSVEGFLSGGFAIGGLVIAGYLLGSFLAIVAAVGMIIVVTILLARHALLYLLVVFSPLVFLATVLPFTRGLSSQWWNYLVRYSFMGGVMALIFYVAASI